MNVNKKLKGVIPPMMSPVDSSQNIDEKGVRKLVDRCIRLGVSGLFVLGTMGEGQSLVKSERKRLIEITVDESKGRVPILAGVAAEGTRKVMENTEDALKAGADYIVSLTPYFFKAAQQQELITYFKNLAKNISKPLVIYNNPNKTSNVLSIDTIRELSGDKNIIGIKDSGGDLDLHFTLLREFESREDFSVFSGMETQMDASLVMGSDGIVPGIGTLVPDIFVEMYNKAQIKDIKTVKSLQQKILKIMDGIYLDGYWAWVAGQKYALSYLGLCQEYFTIDNRPLTDEEKIRIQAAVKEYDIRP